MKKTTLFLLLLSIITTQSLLGQDTLPNFSLKDVGNNRIIIGWANNFEDIKQISIQRSFDSLNGFKTILTVPDPTTPQNGYVDSKATNDHMFYRLFIMREKGIFLFSNTKKPFKDTARIVSSNQLVTGDTIQMGDTFIVAKPFGVNLDKFPGGQDSVAVPKVGDNKQRPIGYVPSLHVYTYRDGYVRVRLPEKEILTKYSIKFFEEDGTFLFELKDVREKDFKIDKSNFYHAGWFKFELYEDGKLLEKNKFFLNKDF